MRERSGSPAIMVIGDPMIKSCKTASYDGDKDIGTCSASNQDLLGDRDKERDSLKCTEKKEK
jgi:hypothetical protein